jgi:hypothetical protein
MYKMDDSREHRVQIPHSTAVMQAERQQRHDGIIDSISIDLHRACPPMLSHRPVSIPPRAAVHPKSDVPTLFRVAILGRKQLTCTCSAVYRELRPHILGSFRDACVHRRLALPYRAA